MQLMKPIVLAFALGGLSVPASAVTQVLTPDANYTDITYLLGVANPNGPNRFTTGDPYLTVQFSSALDPRKVGVDWSTWGSPPDTEAQLPAIWYSNGATSVTFTFSEKLSIWGFEVEPNPFSAHDFTLEFYNGATLVDTIVRSADGNGGARLLAGIAGPGEYFTSVRLSSDTDFAIAQLRYQISAVPEPATWAMLILGFGMVGYASRRRRMLHSLSA